MARAGGSCWGHAQGEHKLWADPRDLLDVWVCGGALGWLRDPQKTAAEPTQPIRCLHSHDLGSCLVFTALSTQVNSSFLSILTAA